jgi:predicted Zn-ribbon and HTH transcriptional regulator
VTPPPWEVADVIRMVGTRLLDSLTRAQLKVLNAIARCRTAALGGHRDQCVRCGYQAITFHSCRNRHCPKCQVNAREKWLRKRRQELLPVGLCAVSRYVAVRTEDRDAGGPFGL